MDESPLVSIILPTYNRAALLPRAINSVLSQTYPHWELLVWDDGSTDNTSLIVDSYKDERIKHFHDSNHGKAFVLNRCLQLASADYIAFLDDDDFWSDNKLERQLEILNQHPEIDFIFGNFKNINIAEENEAFAFDQNSKVMSILKTKNINDNDRIITANFLESISLSNYIAFDTVIIKKSMINQIGPFNESLKNAMDFEYWWRLGLQSAQIAYTTEVILYRYKYPGSLSSRHIKTIQNLLAVLNFCEDSAREAGKQSLIPYLHRSKANAWMNLIPIHAQAGEYRSMLHAFRQSLRYHFTLGAVRLLVQSMFSALLHHERK